MKTIKHMICLSALTGGLLAVTAGLAADDAATNKTAEATDSGKTNTVEPTPAPETDTSGDQAVPQPAATTDAAAPAVEPTNAPPATVPVPPVKSAANTAPMDKSLRLNFRGVPLEMVLNYMSDAAGFIIHPKVDVKGKVTVWSDKPLTQEESVTLLKQVLNENGYTAIQDDRILTIMKTEDAKKNAIPVRKGNLAANIPRNSDVVTQIIPVRSLNVVQLAKDLKPLLSDEAILTANESGNSLVMTDAQINIRRITEIVAALDSVGASSSTIKVFPLKYADAKTLASLIKELFPTQDTTRTGNNGPFGGMGGGFGRFRGGGGGGPGGGFPGGGGGNTDSENGHTPTARVSAVSDDHSNSLVVSAPDELMPTISELVTSVDSPVDDITKVEVFHLKHADAVEMADLLTSLFPDDTKANNTDATRRFGGFPFGPPQNNTANNKSDRMKRIGTVTAVADRRTSSVVVSASTDLMPQIEAMVKGLDENDAHKMKVFSFPLANADPQDVLQVMQDLFQSSSTSRSGSSGANSTTANPLTTRSTTLLQQQLNSSSSSSFGGNTTGKGF